MGMTDFNIWVGDNKEDQIQAKYPKKRFKYMLM